MLPGESQRSQLRPVGCQAALENSCLAAASRRYLRCMGDATNSIITIDGPVASGKSTVAREVARRLGFRYLDTGAMYRALTLAAQRAGTDLTSADALIDLLARTEIRAESAAGNTRVFLDGEEVTEAIRRPDITRLVHRVADCGALRPHMVERQRQMAAEGRLVAEGRDMGTVVFPEAPVKLYLEASLQERVRRRTEQLVAAGVQVEPGELRRDIEARDHRDKNRSVSPLRVADGAIVVDSTGLTVEEVVERVLAHCRGRLGEEGSRG